MPRQKETARGAVVFGTTHTHCRLDNDWDPMLAKLLATLSAPTADPGAIEASPRAAGGLWRAFAHVSAAPAEAAAACLWARLQPILLQRTTPTGEPGQVDAAWQETGRRPEGAPASHTCCHKSICICYHRTVMINCENDSRLSKRILK